jgi:uncharacterized protein
MPSHRHIIIGGGSGFIGSALAAALRSRGNKVTLVSRVAGAARITWEDLAKHGLPACDVVVNLAGQHILDVTRRWNATYRDEVINSRVETTKQLVKALNESPSPPEVFVSTAGKCFYGTRELNATESYPELDEDSKPMGLDFPAELVGQWEAAADGVDGTRIRHIKLRIGVVLGKVERASHIGRLWQIGRARISSHHSSAILSRTWRGDRHRRATAAMDPYRRHGGNLAARHRSAQCARSLQRSVARHSHQSAVH